MMPHNLVITEPGARERIGRAAEKLTGTGNARQRAFVPRSREVLWHSRLLNPADSQRLSFVAPTRTGDYPYVCTFPGHWTVMHGCHARGREARSDSTHPPCAPW